MEIQNWIELGVLILLVLAIGIVHFFIKKKLKQYEGFCGINHGEKEEIQEQLQSDFSL